MHERDEYNANEREEAEDEVDQLVFSGTVHHPANQGSVVAMIVNSKNASHSPREQRTD